MVSLLLAKGRIQCVLGLHLHQVVPLCVLVQAVALCRLLLCVRWLRV
jgi:hypothetical protein